MPTSPTQPSARRPATGTIARLYVLWVVSSVLLALLVIIVTLFASGQLRRHAERISEHSQAIDRLHDELSRIQRDLSEIDALVRSRAAPVQISPPPSPVLPEPGPPAEEQPTIPSVPTPDDRDINARLRNVLRVNEDGSYGLANRAEAEATLREGLRGAGRTSWSGSTWARLAVLARLLDRDAPAEMFALRAVAANEFPHAYYELSARRLLGEGRVTEAIVFARRLAVGRPGDPRAMLLLAEAYHLGENHAAAAAAIEGLENTAALPLPAKLRLGRLLVALEHWDRLEALLSSLGSAPPAALPQLNFLRAVMAVRHGRPPEALAILDNLLVEQPDDYELRTWRGVALLEASQFQAAREALAHAEEHPDRPEAWYWRGMLEIRAGNLDEAVPFLQHALAASQRFAPAWEALGTIALNRNDLAAALQNLQNAVNANPGRASTHFLIAVSHAKASRPDDTAEALRTAFRLAPALLETARQTEVINRLFSDDEFAALAGTGEPSQDEAADAPSAGE